MAVDLKAPLAWKTAAGDAATLLDELQPNILKRHVVEHLSVMFLRFDDGPAAKAFLGSLVPLMKSARRHLVETERFKTAEVRGTPYVGVGLSADGYSALGIAEAHRPADNSFHRGMRDPVTRKGLGDPPISTWDPPYRDPIHAIVLVGDRPDASVAVRRNDVEALLPDSVTVLGEETGLAQRNPDGNGIEHFGYLDGRSQPLFLVEDIAEERSRGDGTTVWDPAFPLEQVLVADRGAPDPSKHFGSYFVFRKLEQNVRRFKEEEERLADQLNLPDEERERTGAMLVGRFEDGTPLTLQSGEGAHNPVMNDFTYASDDQGMKCPYYAHIRKVNPRGPAAADRSHLMARRGQTYGVRLDDIHADLPPSSRPVGGVGLLFMAFNASISGQFERMQSLANDPGHPERPTDGVDPIIGQGTRGETESPTSWGGDKVKSTDPIAAAVRMKGGEYFFMPSLKFLRSLCPSAESAN
jgi:Dyp-type peroxidase family